MLIGIAFAIIWEKFHGRISLNLVFLLLLNFVSRSRLKWMFISDMPTVFHAWPYGRFIEIQSNLRRKKLHRTNQSSNFLGGSCSCKAGGPSSYLDMLQVRVFKTGGPSFAGLFWIWAHCRNVASLGVFCKYCFGRCSSELAELVPLHYSRGRSTCNSNRLRHFSVTISGCHEDVYVNSFFPRTVPGTSRIWNCLSAKCFPLRYDLNKWL